MTLYHFLGLGINQQADYVWQGKFIDTRSGDDHRILLYNLGDFYAEVFYNVQSNKITHIKGFKAISHLSAYLP